MTWKIKHSICGKHFFGKYSESNACSGKKNCHSRSLKIYLFGVLRDSGIVGCLCDDF